MIWLIVIAAGLWLWMVWGLLSRANRAWDEAIEGFEEDEE